MAGKSSESSSSVADVKDKQSDLPPEVSKGSLFCSTPSIICLHSPLPFEWSPRAVTPDLPQRLRSREGDITIKPTDPDCTFD